MGWFSSCEHEWEDTDKKKRLLFNVTYIPQHKCKKCGKVETCIGKLEHNAGYWVEYCIVCDRWLDDNYD